jgi:chromosome segregation ATPase
MPPTNNTNNHNSTANEGLVNKLQEALAKFRKDRDQLHRSKELELERCRLIKSEEEALLKTVQTMRDKLAHLQTSKTKIESQMGPLEVKVQKDSLEVRSASKAHGIEALLDHIRTFFSNSNICFYIFRCNSSTTNCSMLVTRSSS